MQTVSTRYTQLFAAQHTTEVRAIINDVTYTQDKLISERVTAQLFAGSAPTVGGCIASRLDLTIIPGSETIPRNAEIRLEARLKAGTQTSEWIPEGVFYIFRRKISTLAGDGTLQISAYDCIAKLNRIYLTGTITGWPKTMRACAQDIAGLIGTSIDTRTVLSNTWLCQIDTTLTMADYMSYIASAHGGTWISAPDGKLRLVSALGNL